MKVELIVSEGQQFLELCSDTDAETHQLLGLWRVRGSADEKWDYGDNTPGWPIKVTVRIPLMKSDINLRAGLTI